MGHDEKERSLFAGLSQVLLIDNPRRLIRLRNTYRLMKLMWYRALERRGSREDFDPLQVMQVLFMTDVLSELGNGYGGAEILLWLAGGKKAGKGISSELQERRSRLLHEMAFATEKVVGAVLLKEDDDTAGLFALARTVMLPHVVMDPQPGGKGGVG
jgi:hypothetical protein